jgi:hypothetical protein
LAACFAAQFAQAQTLIIPQIADGGGWQTTLVVINTTTNTASASFSFFQDTSGGQTQSWDVPFVEGSIAQNLTLPGGATIFLHTPDTSVVIAQGWGQLQASPGVVSYAIFSKEAAGVEQDATAPGETSSAGVLVPYDNTAGLSSAVALVNPTLKAETVTVTFFTDAGTIFTATLPSLPAMGHMSFVLPSQFQTIASTRGLAEFYTSGGGSLSMVSLRANPTGAFTSAPVYPETGAAIFGSATQATPSTKP